MDQTDNPHDRTLETIAHVVDTASDMGASAGTNHAFDLIGKLEQEELSAEQTALLHYFKANAWENRLYENGKDESWDWEIPEIQNQIIELRKCINNEGFSNFYVIRQCQVLTNLGNKLNTVGRCIEALEYWDRALIINKHFAMALGNRGLGLSFYGRNLYDHGHAEVMLYKAWLSYKKAASSDAFIDSPGNFHLKARFEDDSTIIGEHVDIAGTKKLLKTFKEDFGDTQAEQRYRKWVLHERLFLNPLNDLGKLPIAAHDVTTLPSVTIPVGARDGRPPQIIGFYNQLKQEFVSARWLFFESLQDDEPHFSDKDVLLYNTLEYPRYSLSVEKMRTAFRVAYSLFDKTAFFLNHYFELGHAERTVNFRNVWYKPKSKEPKCLHPELQDRANWSLRGLFWLSKDIFELNFKTVTDPDARELYDIRNHLEHKYLQVFDTTFGGLIDRSTEAQEFGFHIGAADLSSKTKRTLKLARACLIYLSLAVHKEEKQRQETRGDEGIVPMPLDTWDDDWKR